MTLAISGYRSLRGERFCASQRPQRARRAYRHFAPFNSTMTHCSDPREAIELLLLRERMRD